ESTTVVFRVTVNSGVAANTEITNGANWGAEDIYPGGNSNLATVTVIAPAQCVPATPDLTISKTHTGTFKRGDTGDFTITVSNLTTGSTSGGVTVTDTAPDGLVPASATGAGWSCATQGQKATCTRNDVLGPNASYPPITLTVNVSPTAADTLVNTVVVSGGGETNTANNTATDTVTIVANPACSITICFRSAAYYSLNFNNADHPRGIVLINGQSRTSTDNEVKLALDGRFGSLTREFTAFQLSLLRAGGIGSANVDSALMSSVSCYGLFFSPVTLSSGCGFDPVTPSNCTLTQQTRLGQLRLQTIAVTSNSALRNGRDGCVLLKLFQKLNGVSSANVCFRPTGIVDFTSCN
ncbi:MAG: DUF11 domain-containing protein, partial [Acidobacteria bacterium]|nr:DUF11 domain-containing protein [Acidobacteriota bacterium]